MSKTKPMKTSKIKLQPMKQLSCMIFKPKICENIWQFKERGERELHHSTTTGLSTTCPLVEIFNLIYLRMFRSTLIRIMVKRINGLMTPTGVSLQPVGRWQNTIQTRGTVSHGAYGALWSLAWWSERYLASATCVLLKPPPSYASMVRKPFGTYFVLTYLLRGMASAH